VQTSIEERIERIKEHKGVKGLLIVTFKDDKEVVFVRNTMPPGDPMADMYGKHLSTLARQARNLVRDLDPKNDLTFMRIMCKKYEMMVAPDKEYFLIVCQCPNEETEHA
jgi:dynein light chain roadblock-type